jgi:transcriptional regulator with PAS, ATPase and Fis domain
MNRADLIDRLHASPLLRRLPPSRLDRLASTAAHRTCEPGVTVLHEGEEGRTVLLVLDGQVGISKRVASGEEVPIALRGAGDWIGEMALLDQGPRSASATTRSRTALAEFDRDDFLEAVLAVPDAALDLLQTLTGRLREADRALIEALTRKADRLERHVRVLATENQRLGGDHGGAAFERFLGASRAARRTRAYAQRAAESDVPVLLLGETGTGKEVVARAIHAASDRAARPFVALNCALLSETLLESELFGHVRGAFTGATANKAGLVEVADGGTLFLDEVGDLPRGVQGALLRFLELGEYRRLGDTASRTSRVRVIAATHVDLDTAVHDGRFRADLLYRIDVLRIEIPPLRDRREDLPLLFANAMERSARRRDRAALRLSQRAREALETYAFPGNVRELENEIERLCAIVAPGGVVEPEDLSPKITRAHPASAGRYVDALRSFKTQLVQNALIDSGGLQVEAARRLGVHPANLARMIRELGLRGARASRGTAAE